MANAVDIIGVGSPLMDRLAQVGDGWLAEHVHGAKGGMELIAADHMDRLVGKCPTTPGTAPGGSAGNTIVGLARLGARTALLGMLGRDATGDDYAAALAAAGVETGRLKRHADVASGQCISLITPDSQRTMRTCLGASACLSPADVTAADFRGARLVHVEGYVLFNRDLAVHVLEAARDAGCLVSLDLASFEVVRANADVLDSLLNRYVDIVFANEDEAAAYSGSDDPAVALDRLAAHCHIAAVKLGPKGAIVRHGRATHRSTITPVTAVDTTGAGDLWAAGFLFGLLHDRDIATCCRFGATLGAEVVQVVGAAIPPSRWTIIKETVTK